MFTRKKHFSSRLKFSPSSFGQIISRLKEAGFSEISVKIPREYNKFGKIEFSPQEFINLNYNFVSQILTAKNASDTIKILFINNSDSKAIFDDTVFPSSNSEFSKYYVETKDPMRIVGLLDFVGSLLKENSLRSSSVANLQRVLILVASTYLFFSSFILIDLAEKGSGIFSSIFYSNTYVLSFLFVIFLLYIFFYTITPGGLYLNKFEHPIISFTKRIFIGDLKDNLIISSLIRITKILFTGFIVNILWYFFGDIIINALKFLPSLLNID